MTANNDDHNDGALDDGALDDAKNRPVSNVMLCLVPVLLGLPGARLCTVDFSSNAFFDVHIGYFLGRPRARRGESKNGSGSESNCFFARCLPSNNDAFQSP